MMVALACFFHVPKAPELTSGQDLVERRHDPL